MHVIRSEFITIIIAMTITMTTVLLFFQGCLPVALLFDVTDDDDAITDGMKG